MLCPGCGNRLTLHEGAICDRCFRIAKEKIKSQPHPTVPPSEPGWYWFKSNGGRWRIVQIWKHHGSGELATRDIGTSFHYLKDLPMAMYQWQGPVPEPSC